MDLNSDFTRRVVVHAAQLDWQASPMAGVDRRMLDRLGDEVARATSIVRYAPGSHFSPHVHTGGEEFLVLEGVFQDEHGDYPAGSYIRNPPSSSHTPGSDSGCIIFVKLWQFDLADRQTIRLDSLAAPSRVEPSRPGVQITDLYQDRRETVRIETWSAQTQVSLKATGGIELLLLEGSVTMGDQTLVQYSWVRLPEGDDLVATVGDSATRVWIKTGHLPHAQRPGA